MKTILLIITMAALSASCKKSEFSSSSNPARNGNGSGNQQPTNNGTFNPNDKNTWPKDPYTNIPYNPNDPSTWPKDSNSNVSYNPGDASSWPKNPTTNIPYNPSNPNDPNNPAFNGSGGNGTNGGGNGSAADCAANPVADPNAVVMTPLITNDYRSGDMGRNSTSAESKAHLANLINPICLQTYVPNSALGTALTNPQISSDRATRDAVCRLFGYNSADDSTYGYWKFASPHNNTAAAWDAATSRLKPMAADRSPVNNKILVWTKCVGKMKDACKNLYITNTFKCGI